MPRKTLSVWKREHKKQFEQELKQYSLTALKNVMRIADRSLDERVRLQANQYILDKVLGKNFVLFSELEQQNKETLNINLISVTENGNNKESGVNENIWDLGSDDWGEDTYQPQPLRIDLKATREPQKRSLQWDTISINKQLKVTKKYKTGVHPVKQTIKKI